MAETHDRKHYRLHSHSFLEESHEIQANEKKTLIVFTITATMMVTEIVAGYLTRSMSLQADGWHMASDSAAMLIALLVYRFARNASTKKWFSFGSGKFIPLGGYTTALMLAAVSTALFVESIKRFFNHENVEYSEALWVTAIGLGVNLFCIFILKRKHGHSHDHEHGEHGHAHEEAHRSSDTNFRSTYAHVIADAVTSVAALIALSAGKIWGVQWLDPAMGILGALVILKWSVTLCWETAWELLDGHAKDISTEQLKLILEDENCHILDLHVWKIAPNANACEIVVCTSKHMGAEYYKKKLRGKFPIRHIVIEELVTQHHDHRHASH